MAPAAVTPAHSARSGEHVGGIQSKPDAGFLETHLVLKSDSQAKITLKHLIEALTSPDQVTRNSAINNALSSAAIYHAHAITIHGAARIKHFLTALSLFKLSSTSAQVRLSDIEYDRLSSTAYIRTLRHVRPALLPFHEFQIPVMTTLVFNAHSDAGVPSVDTALAAAAIDDGKTVTRTVGAAAAGSGESGMTSLYITKWDEEWPSDSMFSTVPWPLTIYVSALRSLLLPLLVTLILALSELFYLAQEGTRHIQQQSRRSLSHLAQAISNTAHRTETQLRTTFPTLTYLLPTLDQALSTLHSLPWNLLSGPARLLESSAQHTTEALNTLLPARAQLPSPRLLGWYEEQHARSVMRKHSIHAARVASPEPDRRVPGGAAGSGSSPPLLGSPKRRVGADPSRETHTSLKRAGEVSHGSPQIKTGLTSSDRGTASSESPAVPRTFEWESRLSPWRDYTSDSAERRRHSLDLPSSETVSVSATMMARSSTATEDTKTTHEWRKREPIAVPTAEKQAVLVENESSEEVAKSSTARLEEARREGVEIHDYAQTHEGGTCPSPGGEHGSGPEHEHEDRLQRVPSISSSLRSASNPKHAGAAGASGKKKTVKFTAEGILPGASTGPEAEIGGGSEVEVRSGAESVAGPSEMAGVGAGSGRGTGTELPAARWTDPIAEDPYSGLAGLGIGNVGPEIGTDRIQPASGDVASLPAEHSTDAGAVGATGPALDSPFSPSTGPGPGSSGSEQHTLQESHTSETITEFSDNGDTDELVSPDIQKVKDWQHQLERAFLRKTPLQEAEMVQMAEVFTQVGEHKMSEDALKLTKIGKVMKKIILLKDKIPREAEFKFKQRAEKLCKNWKITTSAEGGGVAKCSAQDKPTPATASAAAEQLEAALGKEGQEPQTPILAVRAEEPPEPVKPALVQGRQGSKHAGKQKAEEAEASPPAWEVGKETHLLSTSDSSGGGAQFPSYSSAKAEHEEATTTMTTAAVEEQVLSERFDVYEQQRADSPRISLSSPIRLASSSTTAPPSFAAAHLAAAEADVGTGSDPGMGTSSTTEAGKGGDSSPSSSLKRRSKGERLSSGLKMKIAHWRSKGTRSSAEARHDSQHGSDDPSSTHSAPP
ncbi:hypothetical protein V8E36_001311 [Tilletia maclaganii]